MTIFLALCWMGVALLAAYLGSRGGVLLWMSRAIDYARAFFACATACWVAYKREWIRQWPEALHWARSSR